MGNWGFVVRKAKFNVGWGWLPFRPGLFLNIAMALTDEVKLKPNTKGSRK
jgi:hypothetical protein